MIFHLLEPSQSAPVTGVNQVFLQIDRWNDFSFVTMFHVTVFDEHGARQDLGAVKIGFVDQTTDVSTHSTLSQPFEKLGDKYFSLGNDVDYYSKLRNEISREFADEYLAAMRDMAFDAESLERAKNQDVLNTSILREVSLGSISGQYRRVLDGGVPLTDFDFVYKRAEEEKFAGVKMDFPVLANSKPSTNIHAIIGRNGVGKTTLLNGMVEAITKGEASKGKFLTKSWFELSEIDSSYFSSLVSISFSAFDPFVPPADQPNPELGTCYYYVGLKIPDDPDGTKLKSIETVRSEFVSNLLICMKETGKRDRWLQAISTLESDENFSEMRLEQLAGLEGKELERTALALVGRMSSGHVIVLLIITRLVARVEEKTLVLLDEPESHLHPPLLSAFTRALSELLFSRNGVAIVATHSPVVLQEVPKSCVWKITRSRLAMAVARPEIETFGENVGILTREVFGLEVVKSGYHTVLDQHVAAGLSFSEISDLFDGNLGFEAQAILQAMVYERDRAGFDE